MATLPELENALRKADAAGNADDARALANAIRQMRVAKPDFSNVQGSPAAPVADVGPLSMDGGAAVDYQPGMGRVRGAVGEQDRGAEAANRQQMFQGLPLPLRGVIGAGSSVARMGRGAAQIAGLPVDEARSREIDGAMQGDGAATVGRIGTDVAMAAVPLSRLGALSKGGQYASSAIAGAGFAGLQPTVEGESRQTNMAIGGGLGIAGQGLSSGLLAAGERAAKAITPEVRALYEAAKARGIDLTPAQLSNSKALKFLQSQLSRLPIIGGSAKIDAQKAAFNRELAREIGEDAPIVTPEVFARAKARHSQQFEDLTSRNDMVMTPELIRKLEAIRSDAGAAGDDAQGAVSSALDAFYRRAGQGTATTPEGAVSESLGNLPGRMYQALDSQLGQVTKLGTPASHYVGQVQSALRSAMDDSIAPADREAWQALRREYGNRKTIRDLVAKGDGGEISPQALSSRVTANNAGKEAMATDRRGGLGELARIGQRIKEPPTSGTAERLMSVGIGAGAVANLPVTLGGLLLGGATKKGLDSSFLAQLLMREGRGKGLQALSPYARAGAVGVAPTVAPKKRADKLRK